MIIVLIDTKTYTSPIVMQLIVMVGKSTSLFLSASNESKCLVINKPFFKISVLMMAIFQLAINNVEDDDGIILCRNLLCCFFNLLKFQIDNLQPPFQRSSAWKSIQSLFKASFKLKRLAMAPTQPSSASSRPVEKS